MPEVKVTNGTLDDQPVLTLAAGWPATDRTETLTVNAGSGLPIKYAVGEGTINDTVTRGTIASVAKGEF